MGRGVGDSKLIGLRELGGRLSPRSVADVLIVSTGVTVLYFPAWPLVASASLDESWRLGLSWAHVLGLHWGSDVVFTFGPLYFLDFPVATDRFGMLAAALAWFGYVIVMVGCVLALVRRSQPTWTPVRQMVVVGAATAALVVMPVNVTFQQMHVLVPLIAVVVFGAVRYRLPALAWLAGALVGMLLLHKLSDAALAGGFAAIALSGGLGWRGAARFAVATLVAFIGGWLLAGQPLAGIPAFAATVLEVVRGYGVAMATQDFALLWQYPLAIVVGISSLAAVAIASRDLGRWPRLGLVVATGWALWIAGKEGFTRHDGHYWYFFGIVFIMAVALALTVPGRRVLRLSLVNGAVAYLMVSSIYMPLLAPIERDASVRGMARVLGAVSSGAAGANIDAARADELRTAFGITPELTAALGTAPTIVDPWQIAAIDATDATWDPVPVIQIYAAYTPELDKLNADSLRARPRQILRGLPYVAIDGRFPTWESPTYQRYIYCGYDVDFASPAWVLLKPGVDRCGEKVATGTLEAAAYQPIAVPTQPNAITLVTITPHRSVIETVVDFVAKPWPTWVGYGGQEWRLPQTPFAPDLMLNAPQPHAGFTDLPTVPLETIYVTRPATLEFSFVEVR